MRRERRETLRRTYLRLGTGELAAAAVFAVAAATVAIPRFDDPPGAAALASALVPLVVILVQAGVYWLLARSWVEQAPMPAGVAATYRVFRAADPVLLLGGLAGVLAWWPDQLGAAVLVAATWLFGVAEYINYFVVRLAYPAHRWPTMVRRRRQPRLVQDLRSGAR
jgi:hypothetical protein